jgi:glucose-1-phosphate cytidylyltransferase
MKIAILAGGLGTRISEETDTKPKPMVLIDDKPILWHLMNTFALQGFNEFVLALGYKSEVIKRWLVDLHELEGNFTVEINKQIIEKIEKLNSNDWKVTALETGLDSQTGGRVSKILTFLKNERVIVTYGDGLANVNINKLLEFHESHGKLATVTAVRPPARFGYLELEDSTVTHFGEKNQLDTGWINGGFFVLEPEVVNYIDSDTEPFEVGALPRLAKEKNLKAFMHSGFWQPMDTLRERNDLANMAKLNPPPWLKVI